MIRKIIAGLMVASVSCAMAAAPAGLKKHPSGLQYKDDVVGKGKEAKKDNVVKVQYTGKLDDGTEFDSTKKHGGEPFSFTLGAGEVIEGWDKGIEGMREGGKRTLVIPPEMGYGLNGAAGVIPPNATLTFDVELVSIPE